MFCILYNYCYLKGRVVLVMVDLSVVTDLRNERESSATVI